jgi:hypothetical protein
MRDMEHGGGSRRTERFGNTKCAAGPVREAWALPSDRRVSANVASTPAAQPTTEPLPTYIYGAMCSRGGLRYKKGNERSPRYRVRSSAPCLEHGNSPMYIYIYIERERERAIKTYLERKTRERERERERINLYTIYFSQAGSKWLPEL